MMVTRSLLFLLCLLLVGCEKQPGEPTSASETLQIALGGEAQAGYLRATESREFKFPADHGLHPGFRNEWWYLTGNLHSENGRHFGYQLTLFSIAIRPPQPVQPGSSWDSERIWMAHMAVTDTEGQQHFAFERFSRENPGLAGVTQEPFRAWLDDWELSGTSSADTLPWQVNAAEAGIALSLRLDTLKSPVLQGENGLSRKSGTPGNASYYYSMTRLPTQGAIMIDGQQFQVSGASWLDREWSTSVLDDDQTGWDWFSLQFDDGRELMYYQLRDQNGQAHPYSSGNLTDIDGNQIPLDSSVLGLRPKEFWQSPAGIRYTTVWQLTYHELAVEIRAVIPQQWMDLSVPYWEGAVEVLDNDTGDLLGRGYLEMVH